MTQEEMSKKICEDRIPSLHGWLALYTRVRVLEPLDPEAQRRPPKRTRESKKKNNNDATSKCNGPLGNRPTRLGNLRWNGSEKECTERVTCVAHTAKK